MHLHTGTHAVQQLLGMQVNMDTIFTTWLTALIVFLVVFAASRGKKLVQTSRAGSADAVPVHLDS